MSLDAHILADQFVPDGAEGWWRRVICHMSFEGPVGVGNGRAIAHLRL